jgi:hypothetical protein
LKLTAADRGPKLVGRQTGYVVGLLLLASGIYAVLVGAGVFQAFQSRSALRGAVFAGLILLVVGGLQFIPWSASAQRSMINAVGFAVLGLVLMVGGAYLFGTSQFSGAKLAAGCVLIAASALIPILGWPSLTKALLVYGYAARIPVAIIMYFAIAGNWGTHYDGLPPNFPEMAFLPKFLLLGVLPQMIIWIAFTVIVGMLFGSITAAIARRGKTVAPAT